MEALVLHTIGLFVFVYFIFSVAASLVIGRAIRFASDDYAEHPILDQPGWSNADQRGAAWAAKDLQSAPRPEALSSPGPIVASR